MLLKKIIAMLVVFFFFIIAFDNFIFDNTDSSPDSDSCTQSSAITSNDNDRTDRRAFTQPDIISRIELESTIIELVFIPGTDLVAVERFDPSGSIVEIWNWADSTMIRRLDSNLTSIRSMDVSNNGKQLALGGSVTWLYASEDLAIEIWNLEDYTRTNTLKNFSRQFYDLQFDSTGNYLITTGGPNRGVQSWSLPEFSNHHIIRGHFSWLGGEVKHISLDTTSSCAVIVERVRGTTGGDDIMLLNMENGQTDTFPRMSIETTYVQFLSDDKSILSTHSDGSIRLWDIHSFEELDSHSVSNTKNYRSLFAYAGSTAVSGQRRSSKLEIVSVHENSLHVSSFDTSLDLKAIDITENGDYLGVGAAEHIRVYEIRR